MNNTTMYQEIAARTGGDIYIGVVGPVRTGKSTFIKRFMETTVLPNMENMYLRERARDELPQSASGRTIMTAEPKFVPEEAVPLTLENGGNLRVRMIDCVGYMIPQAVGHTEDDKPRMVRTPWSETEVPLSEAAEIGTRKVIREHSTIGLVVTTDGTVGDIGREAYEEAEARIVAELKEIHKPFSILLNSAQPASPAARKLGKELEARYGVTCRVLDCAKMDAQDVECILTDILHEFPVKEYCFTVPEWVTMLEEGEELKSSLYENILAACREVDRMKACKAAAARLQELDCVQRVQITGMDLAEGRVHIEVALHRELFFEILSRQTGVAVSGESQLFPLLLELSKMQREYARLEQALLQVRQTGYGIVMPSMEELKFEQPEISKQGGHYGVRLKASAPSIHMIMTNVQTEINPIVGSESQSEELIRYLLAEFEDSPEKLWESNIFGKSLSSLVNDGLQGKLYRMPVEARGKLQETLERIINEGSRGLICILL